MLLLLSLFSTISLNMGYDLKIGLLMPQDETALTKYMFGFSSTVGAVSIALDRVKTENLLPNSNIR